MKSTIKVKIGLRGHMSMSAKRAHYTKSEQNACSIEAMLYWENPRGVSVKSQLK